MWIKVQGEVGDMKVGGEVGVRIKVQGEVGDMDEGGGRGGGDVHEGGG